MTTPSSPILEIKGMKKYFPLRSSMFGGAKDVVHAVDGVDIEISRGEVVALVGESGCGKSTIGRAILGLSPPTQGEIFFKGRRIDNLSRSAFHELRQQIQVVYQDPFSSLNPRMRIHSIIAEPIVNFRLTSSKKNLDARIEELLDQVRLPREAASKFPHEFSGGQRQRIGIARALASNPELIVLDEAVSALDVSVKAQIVNLLMELQDRLSVAMLFISHDLAIVEHVADRVVVMYLGKIVETGSRSAVFSRPAHPYTQALLDAVPIPDPSLSRETVILRGDIPSPINPAPGCRFKTRCSFVFDRCQNDEPQLRNVGEEHKIACHLNQT